MTDAQSVALQTKSLLMKIVKDWQNKLIIRIALYKVSKLGVPPVLVLLHLCMCLAHAVDIFEPLFGDSHGLLPHVL